MGEYNLLFVCKSKGLFDKTSLLLKDKNCVLTYADGIESARAAVSEGDVDIVIVDV